jgi:UDP-N-acetylglucosamine 2-epimerase (non-hydrolysing)
MKHHKVVNVLSVIGTRPEAIKMAPVIRELRASPWARCKVLCTGQHRDLVRPILEHFAITIEVCLDAMRPGQPIPELAARMVGSLRGAIAGQRPDLVLAQGDTTSVLAAAHASFALGVPFGHVEAGLRSGSLSSPFPEEANRVVSSHLASIHFAPTLGARENLLREGIRPEAIHVTGNTVIDSLLETARINRPVGVDLDPHSRLVLVTAHRRECAGEPLRRICRAVRTLHTIFPDVEILWPLHPNPAIRSTVEEMLGGFPRVRLTEPLAYDVFVAAMKRSTLILTDSGGIQEEAPALGKPVLVLRNGSERPEAIEAGAARLVGHDPRRIVAEACRLLNDQAAYRSMARGVSPYGDGRAAARIVGAVAGFFGIARRVRAAG